jgi:chemotaxis protein MotB
MQGKIFFNPTFVYILKIIFKMNKFFSTCSFFAILFLLSSCVPQKKFEELSGQHTKCQEENARLKTENLDVSSKNTELLAKLTEAKKTALTLSNDTTTAGISLRKYAKLHGDLNKVYEKLIEQNDKLSTGNAEETKKIIAKLNAAQEDILKKEDEMRKLSKDLSDKEKNQKETNEKLVLLQKDLQQRELKLKELTNMLSRKDSIVGVLKNTVTAALIGFKDMGLTIQQKNGKVYVSLEERLLFKSGSTTVDSKGEDAIKQIAKVLEKNPDVNVLIEGHTDNVAYTTGGIIKDNWDLSVMRATSVVRIITNNSKVDSKRLTAAGRGEFAPLDAGNTSDARKKNRRIEVILSPKLDEILKVLETN